MLQEIGLRQPKFLANGPQKGPWGVVHLYTDATQAHAFPPQYSCTTPKHCWRDHLQPL